LTQSYQFCFTIHQVDSLQSTKIEQDYQGTKSKQIYYYYEHGMQGAGAHCVSLELGKGSKTLDDMELDWLFRQASDGEPGEEKELVIKASLEVLAADANAFAVTYLFASWDSEELFQRKFDSETVRLRKENRALIAGIQVVFFVVFGLNVHMFVKQNIGKYLLYQKWEENMKKTLTQVEFKQMD
jgi:hypothetical protein